MTQRRGVKEALTLFERLRPEKIPLGKDLFTEVIKVTHLAEASTIKDYTIQKMYLLSIGRFRTTPVAPGSHRTETWSNQFKEMRTTIRRAKASCMDLRQGRGKGPR